MTTHTAGDDAPATQAQPYFLIDMIEVRKDGMQDFITNMLLLLPVFEGYGWQLISATYTLTGQPSTVIHVWQIPTADSLRNTMVRMSENTTYLKLQQTIKSEQQNILSRMPYDPVEMSRTSSEEVATGGVAPGVESARVPGDRATDRLRVLQEQLKAQAESLKAEADRLADRLTGGLTDKLTDKLFPK